MPEKKTIQIALDEREAEMLAGAMAIAACVATAGKIGAAIMKSLEGKVNASAVLVMKEDANLGCAVAEFYGLPCPEHNGKRASLAEASECRKDAVERAGRIARVLQDFCHDYREQKIEAFSDDTGDDWKPTLFSN